jgi:hypothetical protein
MFAEVERYRQYRGDRDRLDGEQPGCAFHRRSTTKNGS